MTDDRLRDERDNRLTRRLERAELQCPTAELQCPTLTTVTHKPSVFVARRLGHEPILGEKAEQKLLVGDIRRRQIPNGDRPQPLSIRRASDPTRFATLSTTCEASIDDVIDNVVSTFLRETETPD
jgi:hypothetical protein